MFIRAKAYIRLSREDLRPGSNGVVQSLDEKFALRRIICEEIARKHGLLLAPEDVVYERESGATIAKRPGMRGLLDLAKKGELPHLISPYVDRLLRGDKRDEEDIIDALIFGQTHVYTVDEVYHFNADIDLTMFEFRALGARMELRSYAKRRRQTSLAALKLGQKFRDKPPYGYRLLRATHDAYGRQLTPASYEINPDEWPIVCEIFEKVKTTSLHKIAHSLNKRTITPPGVGKRVDAASIWRPTSIRQMITNPFYAGYMASRSRVVRGRYTFLKPEDYILSDVKGDWLAAWELSDWQEITATFAARQKMGTSTPKLLTGILYNICGERMSTDYQSYRCRCDAPFNQKPDEENAYGRHSNSGIYRDKLDTHVREVIATVIAALPENVLDAPQVKARLKKRPSRQIAAQMVTQLNREIAEKRRQIEDMMLHRPSFVNLLGLSEYENVLGRAGKELAEMRAKFEELSVQSEEPEPSAFLPLLVEVRQRGIETFWESATIDEQRAVIFGLLRRVDLEKPPRHAKGFESVRFSFWTWIEPLVPAALPALPKRVYRGGNEKGKAVWKESRDEKTP